MKKTIVYSLIAFTLFNVADAYAQLYVKSTAENSSYIFVQNQLLYVEKDVALDGGKIYLRHYGKLLQSHEEGRSNMNTGTANSFLSVNVLSDPSNQFAYSHFGLPVNTYSQGGLGKSTDFSFEDLSFSGTYNAIDAVPINFTGTPYPGNDGLAAINVPGTIRLVGQFVTYATGPMEEYSFWKYPILNSADNKIPIGYGFYTKGTTGIDSHVPSPEITANKATANGRQRFQFRGIPNDGTIEIPITKTGDDVMYMLGNPYPSDFNLNRFLYDNKEVISGVYFFTEMNSNSHFVNDYQYSYVKYTPVFTEDDPENPEGTSGTFAGTGKYYRANFDGSKVDSGTNPLDGSDKRVETDGFTPIIPVGRGFWVIPKEGSAGKKIVFKNSHRAAASYNEPSSAKARTAASVNDDNEWGYLPDIKNVRGIDYTKVSKEPKPMFAISSKRDDKVKNVAYVVNEVKDPDLFRIATIEAEPVKNEFNIAIEKDDKYFQYLTGNLTAQDRIPLTIENPEDYMFDFELINYTNFKKISENIYIYDDYTGEYKQVKEGDKVSFNIPAGQHKNRYFITFNKGNVNGAEEVVNNNSFLVLQNNNERALTIKNPEALNVTTAEMFDINGRLVLSRKNLGSEPEYRFSTSGFADGVYIVKIATTTGKPISKKVIVKN